MTLPTIGDLSHAMAARPTTRRQMLVRSGILFAAAGLTTLTACAPAATPIPVVKPTVQPTPPPAPAAATPIPVVKPAVQPTAPPAPAAATPASAAKPAAATAAPSAPATTVNVVASEYAFEIDKLSIPAGPVHFAFKNTGKMTHDFWVFPPQDLSAYLAKKRAGEKVKGKDYLKDATELFDLEGGKSGEADYVMKPGLYEVACFVQGKNADGSTYVHYDRGQHRTVEVTGPGVASRMVAPTKTMKIVANEWDFMTDSLLVAAGDVTFSFKNTGKMEHDFWVYPLQDRSEYLYRKLKGEKVKGRDFLKGADELFEFEPGQSGEKVMKLTAGIWGTGCFIVGKNPDGSSFIHADKGQIFTFTVK
ncbi:MAG: hypothetical protein EPO26_13760 [Chloroflexota bacterium]|nr:MAG: hypothetical protein EPO26_13760 [Chloroflexota bacterium]